MPGTRTILLRSSAVTVVASLATTLVSPVAAQAATTTKSGVSIRQAAGPTVDVRRKDVSRPAKHRHRTSTQVTASDGTQSALVAAPPAGAPHSTWQVTYNGFSSTPSGAQAQVAFQAAVDVWARIVTDSVPIKVDATYSALPTNVLGNARASTSYSASVIGDGVSFYPSALADALYGQDVAPLAGGPSSDIIANFTNDPSVSFYYGTDGAAGAGQIDFMSVVLHELGHGLGFAGSMSIDANGLGVHSSTPQKFDRFAYDAATGGNQLLAYANNSTALASVLTSQSNYWGGSGGVSAAGGARPRLYAPASWEPGSSFSHLNEATYGIGDPNSLMTPQISAGESIHSPGPLSVAILADEGWVASLPVTTAPQPPTAVTAVPAATSAAVSWTAPSSDGGSAITGYTATSSPGGQTCTTATTGCTVNGLTSSTAYTFTVTATNAIGNSTPSAPSSSVSTSGPDVTAPETTLTAVEPDPTNDVTGDFAFVSSEAGSTFECSLDGATFAGCSSPFATPALTDGPHTFAVRATDAALNTDPSPASYGWTVDTVGPDTILTAVEPDPTNDATADFTFASDKAGSTFTCSVDDTPFTPCSSPYATPALAQGSHSFGVRATDLAGNTDLTPAAWSWTLDTSAPNTTLTAVPPNPTHDTTGGFSFTSTESGSTFSCSLDGSGYNSCSSPLSIAALTQGTHTFAVRATDLAGNTDATPASYSWTVDTTAPDTSFTSTEPDPTNDTTADFTFTSTESGSTFVCSVDGDPSAPCTSPYATPSLSAGQHTLAVTATDLAGNSDPTPATFTWTLDTTAPNTTLTSVEPTPTNDPTGDFTFVSDKSGSTFQCSIDNGAFTSCSSPFATAALAQGSHTLAVRAIDLAGNIDPTPATSTWLLDTTAPDTYLTGLEPNPTNDPTGDFAFTSSESSTFSCSLDGSLFTSCTSPFSTSALTEGPHTFAVRATDLAGNTDPTPASYGWTVDTTAPDTTFTSTEPDPTNDTTADFTFVSDKTGSTFVCSVDGAPSGPCTSPYATPSLSPGQHTLAVAATDLAGNTDQSPATYAWTLDTSAPNTTLTVVPPNPTHDTAGNFSFISTESGSTFSCSLDGGAFNSCSSPLSIAALAQGTHTFAVRATDLAGNTDATPASWTWTVDTTAPDTSFTSTEPDPTNDTTADFTFTSNESSTFSCSLDGSLFTSCTSPYSTSALTEGPHTFAVRATDLAGNTDPSPASYNWTLDTTAPETTFTATEPDPTNDTTGDFTFVSDKTGSTFTCSLDGASFTTCTSPFSTAVLSPGSHNLAVRATDLAGNTDQTPAAWSWTLDTSAPNTILTAVPPNPTHDTAGNFSFTSTESGSTFSCSLDGSAYNSCSSPLSIAALAQGTHTFAVRATDLAGNTDATPASYSWTVDTTAPETTFTATEPDPTNDTTADFTFTSTEASSTFACSLDGAPAAPCTSPYATPSLSPGQHTLAVAATDLAGNTDLTPETFTWTLDTTAPDTSFTATEPSPTNDPTGDFAFVSDKSGSSFQCSIDNGAFTTCSSPYATPALAQGNHTLAVRAIDVAGNIDPTPASSTWLLDTTAPDTYLTGLEPNPTNDATGDFAFTSNESSTFTCSVDGTGFTSCTSPFSTAALSPGNHTIAVRATDLAGNTDPTPASYSWTLDTTAPETTFSSTEPDPTNDTTADFTFTSTESGSTFVCSLDGAPSGPCTSPYATPSLSPGQHTLAVKATDLAGNSDPSPASYSWTLDTTAPDTTLTSVEPTPTNDPTGDFTFVSDKVGSTFACSVDNAAYTSCGSPFSTAALSPGAHTFAVRATDTAGNTDPSPASSAWVLDTTAPDTSFTSTEPDPTNDPTADLSFTSTEAATFQCSLDAAAFASCASPLATGSLLPGVHTFAVRATDLAGNVDPTPAQTSWTLDTTAPDTSFTATEPDPTDDATADFSFASTEAGTFECSIDEGSFSLCTSPFSTGTLLAGVHTFAVRAVDTAGNSDPSPARSSWTLDTTVPDTFFTGTEPDPTNDPTGDFAFVSDVSAATFECAVDGAAFTTCASPLATSALGDGTHALAVRAVDGFGRKDATPASYSWRVDTLAPETAFTVTEPDPTNDVTGDFSFTASESGSVFACSVDDGSYATCSSPFSTSALTSGSHTLAVRATDAADNTDATPASFTWIVDTAAPDTSFTATEADPTADSTGDFTFTSTEASSFVCSLDASAAVPCVSPFATPALTDGTHTLTVAATDAAGNTDSTPATATWTVDTVAPSAAITTAPATNSATTTATFGFSGSDPGHPSAALSYVCALDAAALAPCTSPLQLGSLGDGVHTFHLVALDEAANASPPVTSTWRVDTAAPLVVVATQALFSLAPTVGIHYLGTDGGSGVASYDVRYRAAGFDRGFGALSSPAGWLGTTVTTKQLTAAPGSTYCFSSRARDRAGNTGPWSSERCVASPLDDASLVRSAGWTRGPNSVFYRGAATRTATKGATLTRTGVQARHLALVASTCSTCGSVGVYWNGTLLKSISLRSATTKNQQLFSIVDFISVRTGTVTIKTLAAATVTIDGLATSRM